MRRYLLIGNVAQVCVFAGLLLLSANIADAKYIGADPPRRDCSCNCSCSTAQTMEASPNSSAVSRSERNLRELLPLAAVTGGAGAGMRVVATYNSYNADDSRAQIDTVMGYGWTHSYNIFLFDQLGAMFRFDEDGRVTRYGLGPGGTYITAPGYFETLVKNPDGSFTLTQKDQTRYDFAIVSGTPFLVAGPVWRLMQITDRNGNVTSLTYTAGNLTSVTNAYGRSLTFSYNSQNKLTAVTDPAGRVTTFQYDATGHQLAAVTDANLKKLTYTYNLLNQLTSKVDRAGRTFRYTYQSNSPTAVKDSSGASRATLSNPNNWATNSNALAATQTRVYTPSTTTNTDGLGRQWRYDYNSNGYITSFKAPDGATTTYTYDPGTLMPLSMTDANLHATNFTYDARGNLTTKEDARHNVTTYAYEAVFNMMTSMTDPRSRTTSYTYDSRGNRTGETDPAANTRSWTYDSHGNMLSETDKNGHTTTFEYDGSGNRTKITTPLGNVTRMTYDQVGNLLSRTDANNHTTSYQYDGLNRLIRETDATGSHSTQTIYDGEGNRTQVIDRNNHSTSYQYDLRQRLIKTTDALLHPDSYTYDGNDNRLTMTDRNAHTTAYQYDFQNRMIQATDALLNIVTMSYDPVGNLISQTDANGHTTHYTYDELNRRVTMTDAALEQTTYQYDTGTLAGCPSCGATPGSNLVTGQTDANGKVTYFKYDALDRLFKRVQKVGSTSDDIVLGVDAVTTYSYDAVGNRTSVQEPNLNTTNYQYDNDNRRTEETNAAGDVLSMTYDKVGNVKTVTMPNLNVTTNSYDELDRLIQVSDSVGLVAQYTHDPEGNRSSQRDGNGNTTTYSYDAINRVIKTTDPLTRNTLYQYDNVGNLLKTTDRNAKVTTYAYDAINRRTSMTDALNNKTQYFYDPVGNLVAVTDANGHTTGYTFDAVNRPVKETYADLRFRQFTYDSVGNLHTRTDQLGQMTTYAYNDLYFLTGRVYPSAINDSFTYDLSGRMVSALRGPWQVAFNYDGGNRVTQTVQNGKTISYSYNIPGRTRSVTYPGGRTITEQMDARSRLGQINDGAVPPVPPLVQYTYDLSDRPGGRAYRNGTVATYTYNANNWTVNLQHTKGAALIAGFNYAYDNEGNKQFEKKLHDPGHSEAYQYDAIYRLISYKVGTLVGSTVPAPVTQTGYSLDPVGNWNNKTTDAVTQTRVHGAVNELVKIDATNLTYDLNGNLQNDGMYSYAYDEENRLTGVTRLSDSAVVGQYQYDALGRRVRKVANPGGAPATTLYYHDDLRVIEEQDAGGVTQATYVYGNHIDEALTMDRGGQTYYYHQNHLSSVEAVTDGTGAAVERYSYDAYGAPAVMNGAGAPLAPNAWGTPHSPIGNPWAFTGRQLEEETGLYFYRARYYDTAKGRFLQRDPLEYVDGMNLYEYVRSRPTFGIDPHGTGPLDYSYALRLATAALVQALDSNSFPVRQKASEDLQKLIEKDLTGQVGADLKAVLDSKPPLEVRRRIERILECGVYRKIEADVARRKAELLDKLYDYIVGTRRQTVAPREAQVRDNLLRIADGFKEEALKLLKGGTLQGAAERTNSADVLAGVNAAIRILESETKK